MNLSILHRYLKIDCEKALTTAAPRPVNLDSCRKLALYALLLSENGRADAVRQWESLASACATLSLDFRKIMSSDSSWGSETILHQALQSKDWPSCLVIRNNLRSGANDNGSIGRSYSFLICINRHTREECGVLVYATGEYDGGEIKNALRDGQGKLVFTDRWIFDGRWQNNQKNGLGVFMKGKQKRTEDEDLYIDDLFRGNPQLMQKKSYFKSIFF